MQQSPNQYTHYPPQKKHAPNWVGLLIGMSALYTVLAFFLVGWLWLVGLGVLGVILGLVLKFRYEH